MGSLRVMVLRLHRQGGLRCCYCESSVTTSFRVLSLEEGDEHGRIFMFPFILSNFLLDVTKYLLVAAYGRKSVFDHSLSE